MSIDLYSSAVWFANVSTILLCIVLKVPQMSSLLSSKSAKGMSLPAFSSNLPRNLTILCSLYPNLIWINSFQVHDWPLLLCVQWLRPHHLPRVPLPRSPGYHPAPTRPPLQCRAGAQRFRRTGRLLGSGLRLHRRTVSTHNYCHFNGCCFNIKNWASLENNLIWNLTEFVHSHFSCEQVGTAESHVGCPGLSVS